ncbi:MFS transporter [Kineosporia sp. J2-2]|uniref:MFS transporter n=1 Tax=Kineosporia corallincola TaxID=2835133 RepID=A0ABS5TLS7_9ACTN|nr:MFS transporter [Kineosporia corallincola]MBT0772051.1 MFS transporter [Kineosporia corallincola]
MGLSGALLDLTPLRSAPVFRRLWAGQSVSMLGNEIAVVAVMYQVWQLTHSPAWTGATGLARAVPVIAFGLFGGSLADRGDRRRTYLTALTGQVCCALLLAAQAFSPGSPVLLVLGLLTVQSTFGALGGAVSRTFVPRLLEPGQVAAGLALHRISFQAALLAGPALGGLLLAVAGAGGCHLLRGLALAAAFHGAAGLPPMLPRGEAPRPGLAGTLEGLNFLVRYRPVRAALLTDLAATTLAMPISLFPALNAERFGGDPRTLGLFLSAIGAGGVVASALSGTFTRSARPGRVMVAGAATWALALTGLGLTTNAWAGLACLVVAGAADTVSVVARGTVIQLGTPDHLLGRVGAAELMVGAAGPHLGDLRAGLVATATGPAFALVSGGLASLLAVGAVAASARRN